MVSPEYAGRLHRRLLLLRYPLCLAVAVLLLRFWNLQVVRGEEFAALAESNRIQNERLRAPRGLIVDRHGQNLAIN